MDDPILSDAALKRLTGYTKAAAQQRVLNEYGIPYRVVRKHTIVLVTHVTAWVEGREVPRHSAPNLSAVT
ncbi:hypothetical protein AVE30378_02194 [Achromobacter veterisilvae]|uniref:DUF4224 domain-containing protein n=1 Tax=Achromobacter veterisilvae TaxID=2069367 RepID=A0A446CFQ3_9BURK|nr:DUF4224 domain-containing protein [Achromobacter veterisilvae]SSW66655.1 hypothetical protein AVE30378_02194 [Achromobacter veterisilvae]